jgi:excisionase family DNA binding protein
MQQAAQGPPAGAETSARKEAVVNEFQPDPKQSAVTQMLSYRESATLLGLPVGTLYSLVHARRVPHVRLGQRLVRFPRLELERWVNARTVREQGEEVLNAS